MKKGERYFCRCKLLDIRHTLNYCFLDLRWLRDDLENMINHSDCVDMDTVARLITKILCQYTA